MCPAFRPPFRPFLTIFPLALFLFSHILSGPLACPAPRLLPPWLWPTAVADLGRPSPRLSVSARPPFGCASPPAASWCHELTGRFSARPILPSSARLAAAPGGPPSPLLLPGAVFCRPPCPVCLCPSRVPAGVTAVRSCPSPRPLWASGLARSVSREFRCLAKRLRLYGGARAVRPAGLAGAWADLIPDQDPDGGSLSAGAHASVGQPLYGRQAGDGPELGQRRHRREHGRAILPRELRGPGASRAYSRAAMCSSSAPRVADPGSRR